MKKPTPQVIGGNHIADTLSDFYRFELNQHKHDGKTALDALRKSFHEVRKLSEWGRIVIVPSQTQFGRLQKYSYHIACAFQFLVLSVVFQREQYPDGHKLLKNDPELSIEHFPEEKKAHARSSVNLVLGDIALALMHNILLEMPADSKTILQYQKKFSEITKIISSSSVRGARKSQNDVFETLFFEGVRLGCDLAEIQKMQKEDILKLVKSFWKKNKKEPAFANSFLALLLSS